MAEKKETSASMIIHQADTEASLRRVQDGCDIYGASRISNETGRATLPRMSISRSSADLRAWLRFSLEPGLSASHAISLLATFGLPEDIYRLPADGLDRHIPTALARQMARPPATSFAATLDAAQRWAQTPGHDVLTLADSDYPPLLLNIADPPILLYVRGKRSVLSDPALAIVGARNATVGGAANARAFGRHLASAGWCIVSGLARGIDAAAHLGALDAQTDHGHAAGGVVAVLGTGIDRIYPAAHHDLAERLTEHGAIISELPLGAPPLPHHFPRRNRLVAGLVRGVLVVEAARQSGSLSTARLAVEAGREVFAIPGSIHSPLSRGCHALIRQGAKLVETAQDIADELGVPSGVVHAAHRPSQSVKPSPSPQASPDPLLVALGYDPVLHDELRRRTHWDDATLQARLLDLELDGSIERLPGDRYQRIR